MSLPALNLDDRTFDQLESEVRGLIPRNFPAWTDHNLSDPGVTLMELFAFLAEAAIYQINRVPERSLGRFAGLVGAAPATGEPIEVTLRRALEALETRHRAVTEDEWERLAKQAAPTAVARAKAVVEVAGASNVFPDEQTVSVVIAPNQPGNPAPTPSSALRQQVFLFLNARRLITTRVRVVAPIYTAVSVAVAAVRDFGSRLDAATVQQKVEQAVRDFLSPLIGGVDGKGWEFGRPVFRSELYQLIEGISGVDHVRQLLLNGDPARKEAPLATSTSLARLVSNTVTVVDK
ncbi:MAG: hypothetical protein ACREAM_17970 [Blastocatellia bacterium]